MLPHGSTAESARRTLRRNFDETHRTAPRRAATSGQHNMKPQLTGLVLTYNGERLLDRCLASLSFCDRVVVVDSFSTDRTVAIAEAAGAEVLQRRWEGPGPQFQFALGQITDGWIVSLDQDEICSPELRESILAATSKNEDKAGYWVPRRSWYFDRFLKHSGWYPDYLLRLFKAGRMEVKVSGAHYSFHPQGTTDKLKGDILHYPYESFRQHLDKVNDYAQKGADDLRAKGQSGGLFKGLCHGFGRFARIYIVKRGFLDGRAGFINAVHGAFYAFLKYLRVEESDWGKPFDHR